MNDYEAYDHNGNVYHYVSAYRDRSGRALAEDTRGRRIRVSRHGLLLAGTEPMKPFKRKQGAYK